MPLPALFRRAPQRPRLHVLMHIPKTAGASLAAGLTASFAPGAVLRRDWFDQLVKTSKIEGLHKRQLIICHIAGRELGYLEAEFTLRLATFLRDPVERVVSTYLFWRNETPDATYETPQGAHVPLVDQTLDWQADLNRLLGDPADPWKTRELKDLATWQLAHSMYERSSLTTEQALDRARSRLSQMDFVGLQHRLADDYARYARTCLGVPAPAPLPRINASGPSRMAELSPALRRLIEQENAADIALYEWALTRF